MLNMGTARQMMELYVGKRVSPELAREVMNIVLREFAAETGVLTSKATLSSVADQMEYELPLDCLHVRDVIYDDYRAHKIQHWHVKELEGKS